MPGAGFERAGGPMAGPEFGPRGVLDLLPAVRRRLGVAPGHGVEVEPVYFVWWTAEGIVSNVGLAVGRPLYRGLGRELVVLSVERDEVAERRSRFLSEHLGFVGGTTRHGFG